MYNVKSHGNNQDFQVSILTKDGSRCDGLNEATYDPGTDRVTRKSWLFPSDLTLYILIDPKTSF
jgi:hypothetical protein